MTTVSTRVGCPPRFGTPRTPERPTLGPAVAKVAASLGKPLMPWQELVLDTALELDESGRLAYSELGLTVPRQSGKSILILAKSVHRCLARQFFPGRQRVVYTAQTRKKAREKFEIDYAPEIEASKALRARASAHWGNGNEHIKFRNGSRFEIEASTEKAGHGGTIDEADIDEAFAQADGRLEQAFRPAMITRANKQLLWVSTAGWSDASPYLQGKVRLGRAQAEMGIREGLAYFEWSAPEDSDPSDRDVWQACMPALGHTITLEAIAHEFASMRLPDFQRAYLNMWVPKPAEVELEPPIPLAVWDRLVDVPDQRGLSPVVFAVDMAFDHSRTSVGVAGRRPDGLAQVEVASSSPGSAWVPARLVEMVDRWRPVAVVIDEKSPAWTLAEDIRAAGVPVTPIGVVEVVEGCSGIFNAVVSETPTLRHSGDERLTDAIRGAAQRPVGDRWAWSRRTSTADVTPLVAVTNALHALPASDPPVNVW